MKQLHPGADTHNRARAYGRPTPRQHAIAALGWRPTVGDLVWVDTQFAKKAGRIRRVWLPGVLTAVSERRGYVRLTSEDGHTKALNFWLSSMRPGDPEEPAFKERPGVHW